VKYVFLTFTMEGVTGSPSYVNNKVCWLNEKGIETIVFDHYGGLHLNREIVLENLLPYKDNRMLELFFPPSCFTRRQRARVLERIKNTIGEADDYVIESNSTRLALWGEMLAKDLHAKHLIMNVGEKLTIKSEEEFLFLDFKLKRQELFTINYKAIQNMFKGYRDIPDEEAKNLVFLAIMGVKAEDVPMPELNYLPESEYKILSFGRYKPYFENMIKGVVEFAQKHEGERINFLIMGDVSLSSKTMKIMETVPNLFVCFIPAKRPVPKAVFEYSDVVIATAGCANLAKKTGVMTISMDVESCQPLGVMGYSTTDSVYSSNPNQPLYDVCSLLEDVLIHHSYDGATKLTKKPSEKGYEFQWGLINNDRQYWPRVESVSLDHGLKRLVETFVLRIGGIRLFGR